MTLGVADAHLRHSRRSRRRDVRSREGMEERGSQEGWSGSEGWLTEGLDVKSNVGPLLGSSSRPEMLFLLFRITELQFVSLSDSECVLSTP